MTLRAGTLIDGKGGVTPGRRHRHRGVAHRPRRRRAQGDGPRSLAAHRASRAHRHPRPHRLALREGRPLYQRGRDAGGVHALRRRRTPTDADGGLHHGSERRRGQDLDLRDAIARGVIPGPRILTSLRPRTRTPARPSELRAFVRKRRPEGADLIKIFASKSIREGGGQTMTDEQLQAACGEARTLGLRTLVHAHAASAMKAATLAGCTAVDARQPTGRDEVLRAHGGARHLLRAQHRARARRTTSSTSRSTLGIGNYTEEGFAFMEENIPIKLDMYKRAMEHEKLKILMGTDAAAGAHGRNAGDDRLRIEKAGRSRWTRSRGRPHSRPSRWGSGRGRHHRAGNAGGHHRRRGQSPLGRHRPAQDRLRDEGREDLSKVTNLAHHRPRPARTLTLRIGQISLRMIQSTLRATRIATWR